MFSFPTERKLSIAQVLHAEMAKSIGLVFLFAIITAVSSKIEIPAAPVPFTFQTMAVILSGVVLGKRLGFLSQITYLSMGVFGLPVFAATADYSFGFASLFGPTGGYLLAFPAAAFLAGSTIGNKKSLTRTVLAFVAGETLILGSGMCFLTSFYYHDLTKSFQFGVAPFLVWTVAKIVIGSGSAKSVFSIVSRVKK